MTHRKSGTAFPPKGVLLKGAVGGGLIGLLACAPALLGSGFAPEQLVLTIPIVVGFIAIGAWFPMMFVMDTDEASTLQTGAGSMADEQVQDRAA